MAYVYIVLLNPTQKTRTSSHLLKPRLLMWSQHLYIRWAVNRTGAEGKYVFQ